MSDLELADSEHLANPVLVTLPVRCFRGTEDEPEHQVWTVEWHEGSRAPFVLQYDDCHGVTHSYLFDVVERGNDWVVLSPLVIHEAQQFDRHLRGWGFERDLAEEGRRK